MRVFIYVIILECAAAIVTSIGCQQVERQNRQIGWHIALFVAIGVAALATFLDNGSLLFHPSQWSQNKRSLDSLLTGFAISTGVAIIPALFIVQHYRGKFKKQKSVTRS